MAESSVLLGYIFSKNIGVEGSSSFKGTEVPATIVFVFPAQHNQMVSSGPSRSVF